MTSSYSKVTSVFVLPREKNIKASVFEKLLSGNRFRKPAFLVPENVIYVWTEVWGVNCLRFQKYLDSCERDLRIAISFVV